jgi:ketosteroid isomerase-like protein
LLLINRKYVLDFFSKSYYTLSCLHFASNSPESSAEGNDMGDAPNANETEIRSLVEDWARAVRERDMDGIVAFHTDDILMFDVPPQLQSKGIEAYEECWARFFAYSPGGEGSFDLSELEITASDTVAFCHALVNVSGIQVRLTMGLRKMYGYWLIAHEHHSALEQEQS